MTAPSPAPEPPPDAPRVLLFGHRGAGKSALVGALLQAGETQGETLRGEVIASSVDLPRIRDAVYAGTKLDPYKTELVSYTICLRPWRASTVPAADPLTVVLDDCDGIAAEALLEHPEPITRRAPNSPVARAVVGADAIVLLVDGASTDDELHEAFKDFDAFLNVVHRAKTDARVVGGFPVYLVLTQCDRLARQGDTLAAWEARVQARVDYAWTAFDAHLKDADPDDAVPSPFLAFGSIELTVFAAAIRRPPLPGSTAPTHHPYQVAELFRECFAAARAHHRRTRSSETRLKWTVRVALAAVAALVLGLATVALFPPKPGGIELADRVRAYLASEPPAAARLADSELERTRATLARFQSDPQYGALDADLRAFVDSRAREVDDYSAYRARLTGTTAPGATRQLPDLERVGKALENDPQLIPPQQYGWQDTPAVLLRDDWLADYRAVAAVQKEFVARYEGLKREALGLMLKRPFDDEWNGALDALGLKGRALPAPLDEPLPGSPPVRAPAPRARDARVTYRAPYEFDEVDKMRGQWEQARARAAHLRDLADAVGLSAAGGRPPAALALPKDGPVNPVAVLANLRRDFPRAGADFGEWELIHFPEPARPDLAKRLEVAFDTGTAHAQKLFTHPDTKAGWKALAATLDEPRFRDWGTLLHLLKRLRRAHEPAPVPPNPIDELAKFLADLDTKTFELNATGFTLTIPEDLTDGLNTLDLTNKVLAVTVGTGADARTARYTVKEGELRTVTVIRNNKIEQLQVRVYPVVADGATKLAYRPGDEFRAVLPVMAGTKAPELLWDTGGPDTFRFARLSREPRLSGRAAGTGVTLTPTNANALPALPVLLPK
ncbi:MAG: hypothetical protein FJ304_13970 [Planctomycetes bacterium]|nr:hypothetical protein [Planctomycetota bacterium]